MSTQLLQKNKDLIVCSKEGLSVISLGIMPMRKIKTSDGSLWMLHSLENLNFLKMDPENYILFQCAERGEKIISIQQEYIHYLTDSNDFQTRFWKLTNVRLSELSLREIMVLYSIYVAKTLF